MVVKRFSAVRIPPFGPRLYLLVSAVALRMKSARQPQQPAGKWSRDADYVLLHDLFVVDRISNIDIGRVRHMCDGWVKVEDIGRGVLGVEV